MKNRTIKNAGWIIGCHIVQAILNLIVNMLVARYLGPSSFGVINYAASLVAFVVPIMQLGLRSTLVQEIVEQPEREGETLGTALFLCLISSIASIIGVVSFACLVNRNEKVTIIVCLLYSLNLIFQALQMIQYWFQAKLLSKYTALITLMAYIFVNIYRVILLVRNESIFWFAISQALDYLIISLSLIVIYKKLGGQKLSFSKARAGEMLRKSKFYIFSALMVTVFAQTDKIMLKLMVSDAATGFYSAAVTCAGMTGFIFGAIIDSARPTIVKNKGTDESQYQKNVSFLYSVVIYFALLQSLVIMIFASPIIHILYGSGYGESVNVLRLIVWYTTFSYLGAVRDVWILSENKGHFLWIINLIGAVSNVILNAVLIPIMGMMGAALASLVTQIFTNVIVGFFLKPVYENNVLMLKGLNPVPLWHFVKNLLSDILKRKKKA